MDKRTGTVVLATLFTLLGVAAADNNPLAAPPGSPPVATPPPGAIVAPDPALAGAQKERGIVAEIHLGSQLVALGNVGQNPLAIAGLEGGLFGGYKFDRVIVGLGLSLTRTENGSNPGNMPFSQAQTQLLLVPGARFALLRSADARVELFGEADFGFGHVFFEATGGGNSPSNFQFRYQLGPGLRYWLHPQLAFSALAGLRGDYTWQGTGNVSTNSDITSIFATLAFTGVY
jgi:Outer membrane protein beta-barrel domain